MNVLSRALLILLAGVLSASCSNGSNTTLGTGGHTGGTSGGGAGGGGGSCSTATACGGPVTGAWTVTSFVTAILKNNGTTQYALRGGDATTGGLTTFYQGKLPGVYVMKKQGAVVLGSGGDCCATNKNLAEGTFYEGAIVAGYPSDATEDAVQANIVAARYSK